MRRAIVVILVLLTALLAAKSVLAQAKSKGRCPLEGVVLGPDDRPVPHASVSYQSSGGNGPHAVRTDARGRFTIKGLRADNYDIRATSRGVFSEWQKNVSLRCGETMSLTLRLIYARAMPKPGAPGTTKR
jgi:hypothetical protein